MRIFIVDTETNGLKPDKFWCIVLKEFKKDKWYVFINDIHYVVYTNTNSLVLQQSTIASISKFKEFVVDCNAIATEEQNNVSDGRNTFNVRYVLHNGIDFDLYWIDKLLGVSLFDDHRVDIRDTYILSRLASPKRKEGHSVEAWGQRLGLSKIQISEEQWEHFDPIMVDRCIQDVLIQEALYDHLRTKELRGFSLKSIELEHQVQRLISEQQRNGIFIDKEKALALYTICKTRADALELEMQQRFLPRAKLIREYNPKETKLGEYHKRTLGSKVNPLLVSGPYTLIEFESFNPSSPIQRVNQLLKLGWKPTELTPKGAPKLTEDSLKNLPSDAPKEAHLLSKYLIIRNRETTVNQLLELMDDQGYIHGYINILGASTHRFSSNSPNLQNIPRIEIDKLTGNPIKGEQGNYGWECRDLFSLEDKRNNCLVDVDASGIQLRALAHYGNNIDYIRLVSDSSIDPHKVHSDVLTCTRAVAKTFIYAFLMGAGARKLATVLGSGDIEKGRYLLDIFYKRFPFIRKLKERLDNEVERGYTIALDGRFIGLDKDKPHKAMSVILQSFEAIIMKTAMVLYHKKLKDENIWFKQRLIIHDEFLTETKKDYAEHVGSTMAQAIIDAGEILQSKCPLAAQRRQGASWAHVH